MAAKRGPDTHHVVPSSRGDWDVKRGGADRASGHFETKQAAVDHGRQVSRNQETELRIHNRDGRLRRAIATGGTRTRRGDNSQAAPSRCGFFILRHLTGRPGGPEDDRDEEQGHDRAG